MFHIFWQCRNLRNYWKTIFQVLSDIATTHIPPSPDLAILNLNIDSIPQPIWHVTTHILLAARLSITRLWKTEKTPSIEHTLELVNLHYSYELAMAPSGGILGKKKKVWLPWEKWSGAMNFL